MMRKLRPFFAVLLVIFLFSGSVSAAAIKSVNLTCDVDTASARSMLKMINDWRTSGDAWYYNSDNSVHECGVLKAYTYDYDLEQIALQRAYEIVVSFDHTRPNGENCFSCTYNGTSSYGECIAYGYSTAEGTFKQWQETNEDYSGQGHRRLMLAGYSSIGIAHVVYNGSHFWVQEYGFDNSGAPSTPDISGERTRSVEIDISDADFEIDPKDVSYGSNGYYIDDITYGDVADLPEIEGVYELGRMSFEVPPDELGNVSWKSGNTSVIAIENGSMKAVGAGNSTLTATVSYGGKTYTVSIKVTVAKLSISSELITAKVPACTYDVSGNKPKPTLYYGETALVEGKDYEITGYSGNNTATTNAKINIAGKGNFTGKRTVVFEIKAADLSTCKMAPVSDAVYTGSAIIPDITISQNGKALTKSTHYTVSCTNNINVGTATLTITGKGGFTGSLSATFKIKAKSISSIPVTPVGQIVYTGSAIKPVLTLKDGNRTLKEGTDYTVVYANNVEIGTATITITGKGNYTGTTVIEFEIVDKPTYTITVGSVRNGTVTVSKSSAKAGEIITVTAVPNSGYELESIKVNGKAISGNTFTMPAQNTTVTAAFRKAAIKKNGWVEVDGKYYFYDNGKLVKGWLEYGDDWYYLDPVTGEMLTGWQKVNGAWFYLKPTTGAMVTGWLKLGSTWYYMNGSGVMVTGWRLIGGVWYYFNSSGAMKTGWLHDGSRWYYLKPSGAMATGWLKDGGDWYYLDSSGAMITGWRFSGGYWYYFDASGRMVTGSRKIGGKTYNFDDSGRCLNP